MKKLQPLRITIIVLTELHIYCRYGFPASKVGEMKSPIRYEENDFFITKYFLLFS